jgi:hypothetical protein
MIDVLHNSRCEDASIFVRFTQVRGLCLMNFILEQFYTLAIFADHSDRSAYIRAAISLTMKVVFLNVRRIRRRHNQARNRENIIHRHTFGTLNTNRIYINVHCQS